MADVEMKSVAHAVRVALAKALRESAWFSVAWYAFMVPGLAALHWAGL